MADAGNRAHLGWLRQVAYDAGLTPFALRVAVGLTRYFNRDTGEAFMSQETLASDLSASIDGVRKGVGQLEARGHLEVRRGVGRSVVNRYRPVLKTPTASGDKSRKNPDSQRAFAGQKTPTAVRKNPDSRPQKTPTARPVEPLEDKPLEEPLDISAREGELFGDDHAERKSARPARSAPAKPLPADWSPPTDAYDFGAGLGLTSQDVEFETAKFRDHAAAKGRRQVDWNSAWRNWLRQAVEYRKPRGSSRTPSERPSAVDWAVGGMDE